MLLVIIIIIIIIIITFADDFSEKVNLITLNKNIILFINMCNSLFSYKLSVVLTDLTISGYI